MDSHFGVVGLWQDAIACKMKAVTTVTPPSLRTVDFSAALKSVYSRFRETASSTFPLHHKPCGAVHKHIFTHTLPPLEVSPYGDYLIRVSRKASLEYA